MRKDIKLSAREYIGKHTYDSGYTKVACHYSEMTKEEYATMLKERVQAFVVENRRVMNPVDDLDKHSYFLWINNPSGEMIANVRIVPVSYTHLTLPTKA